MELEGADLLFTIKDLLPSIFEYLLSSTLGALRLASKCIKAHVDKKIHLSRQFNNLTLTVPQWLARSAFIESSSLIELYYPTGCFGVKTLVASACLLRPTLLIVSMQNLRGYIAIFKSLNIYNQDITKTRVLVPASFAHISGMHNISTDTFDDTMRNVDIVIVLTRNNTRFKNIIYYMMRQWQLRKGVDSGMSIILDILPKDKAIKGLVNEYNLEYIDASKLYIHRASSGVDSSIQHIMSRHCFNYIPECDWNIWDNSGVSEDTSLIEALGTILYKHSKTVVLDTEFNAKRLAVDFPNCSASIGYRNFSLCRKKPQCLFIKDRSIEPCSAEAVVVQVNSPWTYEEAIKVINRVDTTRARYSLYVICESEYVTTWQYYKIISYRPWQSEANPEWTCTQPDRMSFLIMEKALDIYTCPADLCVMFCNSAYFTSRDKIQQLISWWRKYRTLTSCLTEEHILNMLA